ncbi:MAG: 6-pyruvoyl tetrahydropterin synthase family protein [Synergistaceae bacterium]
MSNISITKKLHFCCAHRLGPDMGRCHKIHGHNYTVDLELEATSTKPAGPSGSVIDFKAIKDVCQKYLDDTYDHKLLLKEGDPLYDLFASAIEQKINIGPLDVLTTPAYPTAEWMAQQLLIAFESILPLTVRVASVTVWETENAFATARR